MSSKIRSSLRNIQENFKDAYDSITKALQSENYEAGCVRMLYKLYEMYYYNNLQEDVNKITAKALEAASGKAWEEAAGILYEVMDNIMEGELEDDDIDEDYLAALQQNPAFPHFSLRPAIPPMSGLKATVSTYPFVYDLQPKSHPDLKPGWLLIIQKRRKTYSALFRRTNNAYLSHQLSDTNHSRTDLPCGYTNPPKLLLPFFGRKYPPNFL